MNQVPGSGLSVVEITLACSPVPAKTGPLVVATKLFVGARFEMVEDCWALQFADDEAAGSAAAPPSKKERHPEVPAQLDTILQAAESLEAVVAPKPL